MNNREKEKELKKARDEKKKNNWGKVKKNNKK